jgi:eukaryotic-like serine/threonine-protein kinase
MICSSCGYSTPGGAGRCVSCGELLPALGPSERAAAGDTGRAGGGHPDATDKSRAPSGAEPSDAGAGLDDEDPDVTRLGVGPPLIPEDPDVTRLGVGPAPIPEDPDVTRLGVGPPLIPEDPDVTRLVITPGSHASETETAAGHAPPPPRTRMQSASGQSAEPGSPADLASDLVGRPLGTRYQIQALLGAGGMGAVYEAWDRELGVVVAVKTVRREIAADPEMARVLERRFKQELLLARKVTHKNIVRVHDMGEVDGIKYITMPYLEGEDLATLLKREGKLPVNRVMPIARQVTSGLMAAHEAGVVHRDLKPANIMIDPSGEALVMDFGVATAGAKLSSSGPDGKVSMTRTGGQTMMGSVVGTIEYMAPEQARAQPVDQRADIYALGLILYDLLLGRTRASRTESVVAELNLRMKDPPPPPRSIDPDIPAPLDRIIVRCIQPDADARYATTAELMADLEKLDDEGELLPVSRRLTWRLGAAAAVVLVALVGLTWWLARPAPPPVEHEPVSVLIADFENSTGDATFDRTLEPMLKLALEGAGFISAYDRTGMSRGLGVRPPDKLDEQAAAEIAVKQGLGVVLSGSIEQQGTRYAVSMKATRAVTGDVITSSTRRASSKQQVLGVATELATSVRSALGDDTSGSAQRFAMETLSATSLEVVREYAAAMEALSRSQFEEARQSFSRAVALDANFGLAYAGMAIASRNLDRHQEAETHVREAIRHLDGMTDRERYRTRGLFYFLTNDYQACVKEYGDLIAQYAADAAARNNLALCQTYLRNLPQAVAEMREVVKILPNRALYRENLALYSSYSGDFEGAEQEVGAMPEPGLFGLLALAFAQVGQGQVPQAMETYQSLGSVDDQGPSYTASGLGDLAIYEGRFSDALSILGDGAAADLASEDAYRAASKLTAVAYAHLQRRDRAAAVAAAEKALATSRAMKVRFLAGRILVEANAVATAKPIIDELGAELQAEPRSYARILQGLTALEAGNAPQAIQLLTDASELLDTWIVHFDLGRAYLAAKAFPQADSELERCVNRRGEALSLFLDEEPTYGFFPMVYYYQGLVRDGLNSARAADSYRQYLDIRARSQEDPLLPHVRRSIVR